jgi:hypothetical protein
MLVMKIPYSPPRYTFCKLLSEGTCEKKFPVLRTLIELLSRTLKRYVYYYFDVLGLRESMKVSVLEWYFETLHFSIKVL